MKFQDIWTARVCLVMQYCDVITNPRWRTAAILKIVKSPYLSEKSSDFDEIWYTTWYLGTCLVLHRFTFELTFVLHLWSRL